MFVVIILAAIMLVGFLLVVLMRDYSVLEMGIGLLVAGAITLGCFFFIGIFIYLDATGRLSSITSYAEANRFVLNEATDALRSGVPHQSSESMSPTLFDAANLQQIEAFGKVVERESRANTRYNEHIVSQRRWEKNPFFGLFIPDLDEKYVLIMP